MRPFACVLPTEFNNMPNAMHPIRSLLPRSPAPVEPVPASLPFSVLVTHAGTPPGALTPRAAVALSPSFRTGGLLGLLPAEDLKSLVLLLTYVTANGDVVAALPQLADGLRLSEGKALVRLRRLGTLRWRDRPLVHELARESGLTAFALDDGLRTIEAAPLPEASPSEQALPVPAGRAAVYEHVRATYATPRAEAEAMVAAQLGHVGEETAIPGEEAIAERLARFGLPRDQAAELVARYGAEAVERQLKWLPYRKAQNPSRLLVASIEGDYGEPAMLRLRRRLEEREAPDKGPEATP